uniref:AKTx n=1 Tax=Hadrurus spadix TaxID=141984 RepID=A0A1W7RB31_9SCOR
MNSKLIFLMMMMITAVILTVEIETTSAANCKWDFDCKEFCKNKNCSFPRCKIGKCFCRFCHK